MIKKRRLRRFFPQMYIFEAFLVTIHNAEFSFRYKTGPNR